MKCWKCGANCEDTAATCPSCGANLVRKEPASEIGRAMRMLFDRYGAEKIFNNSAYLVNGLGDLTEDSQKVRNQLKMALDAGLGRMYQEQIASGAPDAAFDARVHTLITEEAGLNDKAASEIAGYFDEMIGWREAKGAPEKPEIKKPEQAKPKDDFGPEIDRNQPKKEDFGPEIDRKNPKKSAEKKPKTGLFVILGLALVAVIILMSRGGKSGKQQTTTTTTTSTTTTTKAETTTVDEEAQRAAKQAEMKQAFEEMQGYTGELVAADFIVKFPSDESYADAAIQSLFGPIWMTFDSDDNYTIFSRGAQTGDSISTVKKLYGEPVLNGVLNENAYIYQLMIDSGKEDKFNEVNGDSILRYDYELTTSDGKTRVVHLDFWFDQDTDKLIGFSVVHGTKE